MYCEFVVVGFIFGEGGLVIEGVSFILFCTGRLSVLRINSVKILVYNTVLILRIDILRKCRALVSCVL